MKLCALTPKIVWHYHVPLHRATATAVQMATPVPEIMDERKETSGDKTMYWDWL
jgi:hypothetical protein